MSDWRHKAKCRGRDGEMWFPTGDTTDTSEPRRICLACPVRWECGTEALEAKEDEGIWAGYWLRHSKERTALKKALPGVVAPEQECIECGGEYVPRGGDVGKCLPCVQGLVLAEPAREYLRQLHEWLTYRQLSAMTGLSVYSLQSAKVGKNRHMSRELADAIMSVPSLAVMQ